MRGMKKGPRTVLSDCQKILKQELQYNDRCSAVVRFPRPQAQILFNLQKSGTCAWIFAHL